ncbi:MAG: hypothetical protein H0W08_28000, partial [Acidobacteria bacterium]|nr:hypothetical protein [Acidobacteriota bacterium]
MISERRQTLVLARSFFSRMFESDLMPPGLPQVRLVISVVAFLGAPSLVLPLLLMKKYVWLWTPDALRLAMAQDRTMALLLSMTATAFITLVIWENIFPDRRDSRALGVLPIRVRSFVLARLSAIIGLFAVLFLLTTALSSITFGVLGAMTRLPEGFVRVAVAHFLSIAGAEAFVFFGILTVQCALMSLAGPRVAHRLAVVLQIILIVTVLQMPMVLPPGSSFAINHQGVPGWSATLSAPLLAPLWFLALYQTLIGAPYEGTAHLARAAGALGILTPLAALAFFAASYRRLTRLAMEGRPMPRHNRGPRPGGAVAAVSHALTSTQPGAAVCAFTMRTLVRSRQHRMLLAVWIGVALALTISAALPMAVRLGWAAFDAPRGSLLVGPLIFAALIQTGMRSLFAIPVEIRANWAFRLREPLRLDEAVAGTAAALMICGVVPPVLLAFTSAAWLWGAAVGIKHAILCGAMAMLLVQVLMRGADRVPFTC